MPGERDSRLTRDELILTGKPSFAGAHGHFLYLKLSKLQVLVHSAQPNTKIRALAQL